jgi:hypothetical protein
MNLFHLYKADFWVKLNSTLQNRLVRRGMSKPHKDYLGHIFARCETFGLGVWRTNTSGSTILLTYYQYFKTQESTQDRQGVKDRYSRVYACTKIIIYEENNF